MKEKEIYRRFPLTQKGCADAIEWLKEIGEWERVYGMQENDGYTITDTANVLWERRHPNTEGKCLSGLDELCAQRISTRDLFKHQRR